MDETLSLAPEQYCYLTTTGRRTGKAHTIEIWFAMSPDGKSIYMLSGGRDRADWVKNIRDNPAVAVRIRSRTLDGRGRIVEDAEEERLARRLVVAKYYRRQEVHTSGWEATSLPVAIDLQS